jgi:hypothetical protein
MFKIDLVAANLSIDLLGVEFVVFNHGVARLSCLPKAGCFRAGNSDRQIAPTGNFGY